jgi:hypothetical protein
MTHKDDNANFVRRNDDLELEPELRDAIGDFKSSINSWSESALSQPRVINAPRGINWAHVSKWALGCAVFVGTVSGGVYESHRQQELANLEAARIAQQQRELAAQHLREEADLMAKVDSDIAREVPSALEPLASLMDENQGSGN